MEKMNRITVAMGSVYMDQGEDIEYLKAQIGRMSAQKIQQYYLDIICRTDQVRDATKLLDQFYEWVADIMPFEQVFTAITCVPETRPAAITLMFMTRDSDMEMLDVNPTRERKP